MTYSKEQLQVALFRARSLKDIMINLGIVPTSRNYRLVKQYYSDAGISIPKLTYQPTTKPSTLPDDQLFVKDSYRSRRTLKARLLKIGVPNRCAICFLLPEWQGKKLTLQLDHIDGDTFNNSIENLRLLCPNCHSQTETFGGRSVGSKEVKYCVCGRKILPQSNRCRSCAANDTDNPRGTKIQWPLPTEVVELVRQMGYSGAGRLLGVSDNAVRKYLGKCGVDITNLKRGTA